MSLYRKKPVVIKAAKFTETDPYKHLPFEYLEDDPRRQVCTLTDYPGYRANGELIFHVHTLEGIHEVTPGDWIIRGVKGEHYPCKPDIFDLTYEPVDVAEPAAQR